VPVRIHFRGLILFRFPEAQKIVAELISPDYAEPRPGDRQHPHHHQSEIQVLDGTGPSAPRPLRRGDAYVRRIRPTPPADFGGPRVVPLVRTCGRGH